MTFRWLLCLLLPGLLHAATQDPQALREAVADFAYQQLRSMPGEVTVSVGSPDPRQKLPACRKLDPYLPAGALLRGRTLLGVRCLDGANWSLTLQAKISIVTDVVFSSRPLTAGTPLVAGDLQLQRRDLADLPSSVLTDPGQAVGRSLLTSVAGGQPLRSELFRAPFAVLQNQQVRLVAQSDAFRIETIGKALSNAQVGQVVGVRTDSGQVVQGVVQGPGVVLVTVE